MTQAFFYPSNNIKEMEVSINNDLSKISEWLLSNKLPMDPNQTLLIYILNKMRRISLQS